MLERKEHDTQSGAKWPSWASVRQTGCLCCVHGGLSLHRPPGCHYHTTQHSPGLATPEGTVIMGLPVWFCKDSFLRSLEFIIDIILQILQPPKEVLNIFIPFFPSPSPREELCRRGVIFADWWMIIFPVNLIQMANMGGLCLKCDFSRYHCLVWIFYLLSISQLINPSIHPIGLFLWRTLD